MQRLKTWTGAKSSFEYISGWRFVFSVVIENSFMVPRRGISGGPVPSAHPFGGSEGKNLISLTVAARRQIYFKNIPPCSIPVDGSGFALGFIAFT